MAPGPRRLLRSLLGLAGPLVLAGLLLALGDEPQSVEGGGGGWNGVSGVRHGNGGGDARAGAADPAAAAVAARADSLQARLRELRGAGRPADALATARELRGLLAASPAAREWERADAARQEAYLERLAALPDSAWRDLARGDRLDGEIQAAFGRGRYADALALAHEQLAVRRRWLGPEHHDVARSLNRLGVLELQLGDFRAAEAAMRESLAMHRRTLGDEHPLVASNLHNLGTILRNQGDYAGAAVCYEEALARRRRLLPPKHPDIAWSLNNLAAFHMWKNDYARAEPLLREARERLRARLGADSPEVAQVTYNLAQSSQQQHRLPQAEALLREALEGLRRAHGEESRHVAGCLHALGDCLTDQGRYEEAQPLFDAAIATYRRLLGPEHPHVAWALDDLALCCQSRGRAAEAESLWAEAAQVFERARLRAGDGLSRAVFQRTPYERLAAAHLRAGRPAAAWEAVERSRGRALADLLIAAGRGPRAAIAATEPYPLARVQAALPRDAALVGWVRALSHAGAGGEACDSWGYVIRSRGPVAWEAIAPAAEDTGRPPAVASAEALRGQLAGAGAWPLRVRDQERLDQASRTVHARWWAPLEPHLEGVAHVVVIPTDPMAGFPIEALVDADGRCVGETRTVSYVPSATLFAWLRERDRGAALVAAGAALPAAAGTGAAPAGASLLAGASLIVGDPPRADLPPLRGARGEAQRLAGLLPGATLLLGEAATAARMREVAAATGRFGVWHLATHAWTDDDAPEKSALLLAGDERLSAAEIVRDWRLDIGLVTLSGCRTALGRPTQGEGYAGLAHAFLQAGARNLLVSLWEADDEATALLMERFYADLAASPAVSPAAALRKAKLWLRDWTAADGSRPFRHPAYWSGFVLVGEGR